MTIQAVSEKTTACPGCGAPVPWPAEVWRRFKGKPPETLCRECWAERKAAERERQLAEAERAREAAWCRICPPLYRETDPARLPQRQLAEVMRWEPGPQGLLLIGPTGTCKTRAAYLLLHRLLDAGEKIVAYDALGFGHECSHRFGDNSGEAWAARLAKVKVLFLDDFGKCRFTERIEAELFGVIERRIANLLPVIATTNLTGPALEDRMSSDRGGPLVRRLREFCRVVIFE